VIAVERTEFRGSPTHGCPVSKSEKRPAAPPQSVQNPHQTGGARENLLEVSIGREVRAFRTKLGFTVADLAAAAKLSPGMLSKIENGLTSPSLTTLKMLSAALGVPVTAFFRRYEERRDAVFVRAGEGLVIERRGTRAGHQYNLLGHIGSNTSGVVVEPYLITLTEDSDVFPTFQHEGLNHFCLAIEDFDGTLAELRARGVELVGEPFVVEEINRSLAFVKDNSGNLIELSAPRLGIDR